MRKDYSPAAKYAKENERNKIKSICRKAWINNEDNKL